MNHGYSAGTTHAVLNAIDVARWNPELASGPVRAELGMSATAPVIACIARVFRPKGHVELIRAVALVQKEFPDVKLLVVGQDYPKGTGHSAELRALARELGVADSVVFTGQRADVARVLAASDIYAMPSFGEPFGLVYAEAMAMRRPVVALDNGGTPEVVEHGKSGLLSPTGDIDKLAGHLLALIRDPALRARMGEYGRQVVEARFTPERLARDVARVYASLMDVSPVSPSY